MKDQAESLRMMLNSRNDGKLAKTLAVISGKGGVGKSNFSLNFSIALSKKGYKVLVFDMDIGMGNIDILMGKHPQYTILDFFEREMKLKEIISNGYENISIIAGGTGLLHLFSLKEEMFDRFSQEFNSILEEYDFILFDMGAGLSEDSAKFLLCVEELIIITTPEPTSVMDAYSVMKYIYLLNDSMPFHLVCNRADNRKEGMDTITRVQNAVKRFLNKEISPLGILPDDKTVSKAVAKQVPFMIFAPNANVSRSLTDITTRFINKAPNFTDPKSKGFMQNVKRYLLGR
ncbi:flagellar biosynthesis protein FlhG [Bacillus sp. OV322]|uniref:MinD/ParA family protein n=1 Tax=Bacillus sp. OV322 TaxID=1882764 RepID=UPI0008E800D2|nr:MinD/ParA family protein [Bacillus sp. OV322]SFC07559.1 flagellar biosynthesis protein FlhG [Bacillus sp. OV322]